MVRVGDRAKDPELVNAEYMHALVHHTVSHKDTQFFKTDFLTQSDIARAGPKRHM